METGNQTRPNSRMKGPRNCGSAMFTVLAVLFALPDCARAADTYFEPAVSTTVGYDDNVRLDPEEQDDQTRLELITEAEFGAKTRTREAVLNAAAHVNRYSDSELNSTDWFLDLDLLRRWRRDELGLLTSYRRASTLTTELEDSGRLEEDQIREDWRLSPSWTHKLSRRTETTLLYQFTDVSFNQGTATALTDYREHLVQSSFNHALNRTDNVYGRADYTRFDNEADTEADNLGALVGVERNFSRILHAGVGLGIRHIDTSVVEDGSRVSGSDTGPTYEIYADWTWPRSTLSVEGSRRVRSSGLGSLSDVDSLQATWSRSLSRTWDLDISAAAARQEFARTGAEAPEDRKYYDAEARLAWSGWPQWEIDVAYRYRRQEFDAPKNGDAGTTGEEADSNSVWVTMRYTWARMDLFQ